MKQLTFGGYSDDTFYCEGQGVDVDMDNCASGEPIRMRVSTARGTIDEEALVVCGQYAPDQCAGWLIGVAPADFGMDEEHIPDWPMRFARSAREYSPLLIIDAPDEVTVELLPRDAR